MGGRAGGRRVPVFAINPLQVARYRERHGASGAKSDAADAHVLADMVRTDSHQLRPVAGDTAAGRGDQGGDAGAQDPDLGTAPGMLRLRQALREYFPAALEAFEDLDAARYPGAAGQGPRSRPGGPADRRRRSPRRCKRARRRNIAARPQRSRRRCAPSSSASPPCRRRLRRHRAGARSRSWRSSTTRSRPCRGRWRPILAGTRTLRSPSPARAGTILGARVLAEFGDDPDRYARPKPARTTPAPARSPAPRARRKSCWPATCTTTGSSTPCTSRPSPHSRLARRPRLLRPAPRPRSRPPRRPAPARQPTRRHPARLPQNRHPLRRDHRLGTPRQQDQQTAA